MAHVPAVSRTDRRSTPKTKTGQMLERLRYQRRMQQCTGKFI